MLIKKRMIFFLPLLVMGCALSFPDKNNNYCNRINEIKVIPFKGEKVDDKIYNLLKDSGINAVLCLADRVTDITIMPDPRKAPPYENITVGDVALFVIVDIIKVDFENILPKDVRNTYREKGIYAYYEFVKHPENREIIKENVYKIINQMK